MKRKLMPLLIIILLGLAALLGLYIAVYAQERRPDAPQPADCIIVLGNKVNHSGPSLSLRGRLERGLELYNCGYADSIIVCGGQGSNEPATEASVMKAWLCERGVPEAAIHMDEVSTNTKENIAEAKRIMQQNGYDNAIICTSDFHSYRAMRITADAGVEASPAKARTYWSGKPVSRLRECASWVKYFLGL